MAANSTSAAFICDGCGRLSGPEHLARRVARLERSTRFRPIHIHLLLVAEAPPADENREFYGGSNAANPLLDALGVGSSAQAPPASDSEESQPEQRLAAFQKLGLYLAYLVECPLEAVGLAPGGEALASGSPDLARRFAPTLLKRIRFSYRPKRIVLLSRATLHLIPLIEHAGLGGALLLNAGAPLEIPRAGNLSGALAFRTLIEGALATAAARG